MKTSVARPIPKAPTVSTWFQTSQPSPRGYV